METTQKDIKDMEIKEIWQFFREAKATSLRNFLMEKYLSLVKYNAERIYAKLPDEVELDDLISAGIFGLMDAIDAYDLNRGVKFETYCAPRIRGAILDELAPRMGLNREEFVKLKRDATAVSLVSLSRKWFETDSQKDVCEIDVLEDKRGTNPLEEIQKRDLKEMLTKGLSRAERLILVLYYYEEMTMKEIGSTLDLSESRVSQMHSSILARLKAQMSHQKKELEVT